MNQASSSSPLLGGLPLGEVHRIARSERKNNQPHNSNLLNYNLPEDVLRKGWTYLDEALKKRADYKLWRRAVHYQYFRSSYGEEMSTPEADNWNEWPVIAEDVLCSSSQRPIVLWGSLGVLGLIFGRDPEKYNLDEGRALELAEEAQQIIEKEPALPEGLDCRAGCSFVKLLVRSGLQRLRANNDDTGDSIQSIGELHSYLREVREHFCEVEGVEEWKPGNRLSLEAVSSEDYLIPQKIEDLGRALRSVSFRTRRVIRKVVKSHYSDLDNETEESLLLDAAGFALSAWHHAHGYLRGIEAGNFKSTSKETVLEEDLWALDRAALAYQDLGSEPRAAALNYVLLWRLPNPQEIESGKLEKLCDRVPNNASFWLRQMGLDIPSHFAKDEAERDTDENEREEEDDPNGDPGSAEKSIRELRRARHKDEKDSWRTVLEWAQQADLSIPDRHLPMSVAGKAADDEPIDSNILEASFELCLQYGYLNSAAHLLERLTDPDFSSLMEFARRFREVQQLTPTGIDEERHQRWRKWLREAWSESQYTVEDEGKILTLHETLMGRYTLITSEETDDKDTHRFIKKHYGIYGEDQRKEWEKERAYRTLSEKGPGAVNLQTAKQLSKEVPDGVVFASIVLLDEDRVSLLVGPSSEEEQWVSKVERIRDENGGIKEAIEATNTAFAAGINSTLFDRGFRYPQSIRKLRDELVSLAHHRNCKDFQWLVIAPDPKLGYLPWQHILSKKYGEDYVVSLIPSISWASRSFRQGEYKVEDQPKVRTMDGVREDGVGELMKYIEDDANKVKLKTRTGPTHPSNQPDGCSVSVIAGHGTFDDSEVVPKIQASQTSSSPLSLEDWLELANRRLVLIHSCYGGQGSPQPLGDLGGIPYVALGMGCRLLCAPVTGVPSETARTLHEQIISAGNQQRFGERYLDAISEDRNVAFYNLYGFAFEELTSPNK